MKLLPKYRTFVKALDSVKYLLADSESKIMVRIDNASLISVYTYANIIDYDYIQLMKHYKPIIELSADVSFLSIDIHNRCYNFCRKMVCPDFSKLLNASPTHTGGASLLITYKCAFDKTPLDRDIVEEIINDYQERENNLQLVIT